MNAVFYVSGGLDLGLENIEPHCRGDGGEPAPASGDPRFGDSGETRFGDIESRRIMLPEPTGLRFPRKGDKERSTPAL